MKLLFLLAFVAFAQADWSHIVPKVQKVPVKVVPSFHLNNRIIGGQEATLYQFPYQAGLFIDGRMFCGGSLISKNYVLTAAHCTYGAKSIEVVLGAHNVQQQEASQVRITSTKLILHEGWNPTTLGNDISLIKLPTPVPFNDAIKPINMPRRADQNNDFSGQLSTISGWGKTRNQETWITDKLRFVQTIILTNTECRKYFGGYIHPTHICASGQGNKSTCNGDSGGPLTVTRGGEVTQVGVTSFVSGLGCEASYPHAYTRVTSYLDWIQRNSDVVIS